MHTRTAGRAAAIRQEFSTPAAFPHLEIRTTYDSVHPYAPHSHRTFSVGLILKGRTAFVCGDILYTAEENDIVLIEPDMAHRCNPVDDRPRSYHMLQIDPRWCLERLGAAGAWKLQVRRRLVRDAALALALRESLEDLGHERAGAEQRLRDVLTRLLEVWCVAAGPECSADKFDAARRLLAFSGPESTPSVAEVARVAGMRREAFIRAFHRKTGLSPGAYRHCARLEEGRRLLRLGRSIVEAAQITGYADQSHFHRMFVKFFSATPRQYRGGRSLSFKK